MGHKEKLKCHKLFLKIYDETNHNAESGKFENHKYKYWQQKYEYMSNF